MKNNGNELVKMIAPLGEKYPEFFVAGVLDYILAQISNRSDSVEIKRLSDVVSQLQRDMNVNEERLANLMQQQTEQHRVHMNMMLVHMEVLMLMKEELVGVDFLAFVSKDNSTCNESLHTWPPNRRRVENEGLREEEVVDDDDGTAEAQNKSEEEEVVDDDDDGTVEEQKRIEDGPSQIHGMCNNGIAAHEDPWASRTRVLTTASLEDMEISLETPEESTAARSHAPLFFLNSDMKMEICSRTDVVEVWDATSANSKLLGKHGIEKQPFQLPDFIAAPGIEKIRHAYIEKEDNKKRKQKQRERMQPKMGKMDIDYQVLHDAFFKYQTKLKLTSHGDLYHEGKEFEVKLREMKPGMLSQELKEALCMPESAPPPWLINMQRYGPPHSYPHLKIAIHI
ncbi:hypothetical protein LguiB_028272 [Lonicera macranthoides]